jgi:cbb3-type cytochrome oxidase subunit 3
MNPVFQQAAEQIRLGWLMGITTAVFLVVFVGWIWWSYSGRNGQALEDARRMPLDDGGES